MEQNKFLTTKISDLDTDIEDLDFEVQNLNR